MRFIGAIELLGGFGLILPGLLRPWPVLTPLAAAGAGDRYDRRNNVTLVFIGPAMVVLPRCWPACSQCAAYGRWRIAPLRGRPFAAQMLSPQPCHSGDESAR